MVDCTASRDFTVGPVATPRPRFAFCASTGRTATMFLAQCLNRLTDVVGLHEGHSLSDSTSIPRLPLINVHHRKAWHDPVYADRLVADRRDIATLSAAADGAWLLIDAAFYNAPLLAPIARQHPNCLLIVIFRRCEGFVRSATIVSGEDLQPAGWPDRSKPLTNREKFISLGRLKPAPDHPDSASWSNWSAIQRNIWLWTTVNRHLLDFTLGNINCHAVYFEDLVERPDLFWTALLQHLECYSLSTLAECIGFSISKVNRRAHYQIGRTESWQPAERALYAERARPLEEEIYA